MEPRVIRPFAYTTYSGAQQSTTEAQPQSGGQSGPGAFGEYSGIINSGLKKGGFTGTGGADALNSAYDWATGWEAPTTVMTSGGATAIPKGQIAPNSGTFGGSNIANAAYAYAGGKLANELFDNKGYSDIGGSLGAGLGASAAVGGSAAGIAMGAQFGMMAGPLGAIAGAVLGAAIGSVFGSSPAKPKATLEATPYSSENLSESLAPAHGGKEGQRKLYDDDAVGMVDSVFGNVRLGTQHDVFGGGGQELVDQVFGYLDQISAAETKISTFLDAETIARVNESNTGQGKSSTKNGLGIDGYWGVRIFNTFDTIGGEMLDTFNAIIDREAVDAPNPHGKGLTQEEVGNQSLMLLESVALMTTDAASGTGIFSSKINPSGSLTGNMTKAVEEVKARARDGEAFLQTYMRLTGRNATASRDPGLTATLEAAEAAPQESQATDTYIPYKQRTISRPEGSINKAMTANLISANR